MEYWNLSHTSRSNRGLSLGTQHRIFQSQYKHESKQDDEEEIKRSEETPIEESPIKETDKSNSEAPPAKKARTEEKQEEDSKPGNESGDPTTVETPTTHPESTSSSMERGEMESSDGVKHERSDTKQENEQKSDAGEVRVKSGESGSSE